MVRRTLLFLSIVAFGGVSGVIMERTLVPWLAAHKPFSKIPRLTIERVTVVQPREEVIIDRAQALERAVAAVRPTLVLVERRDARGKRVAASSGVVLTSDGIIVTDAALLAKGGTYAVTRNGEAIPATFLRSDARERVALFSIGRSGLPVVPFAERRALVLGKTLFSLRALPEDAGFSPELQIGNIVGEGEGEGMPEFNLVFDAEGSGSPIFTIDGELVGVIGKGGEVVPSGELRKLLERE